MKINKNVLNRISFATGFDITDPDAKDYIEMLVEACQADLINSGVKKEALTNENSLATSTYIIFVTDNINAIPGEYKQSPMYLINADKLRNHTFTLGDDND